LHLELVARVALDRIESLTMSTTKQLANLILRHDPSIRFSILEIGGAPLQGSAEEPFYQLLDCFPGSQIIAFEVDAAMCEKLNQTARSGVRFFPRAIGRTQETRTFYQTRHPMCCSLYEPNEQLMRLYNFFEMAYLKSEGTIETISLDYFATENAIDAVDFIKIDIQGAELDVFQGGTDVLRQTLAIVTEVEFVPHYVDQPLFGDVSAFLGTQGFMFHKFLGMCGRALRPIILKNDPTTVSQVFWSDAVFVKNILKVPELAPDKLLKLAVLAHIYGSPDLTYYCLWQYEKLTANNLKDAFIELTSGTQPP
jgi:FkbM family methyltransferase